MNPKTGKMRKFTKQLSTWFIDEWEAKLAALVLAMVVWYVVKDRIRAEAAERGQFTVPSGYEMNPKPSVPAP